MKSMTPRKAACSDTCWAMSATACCALNPAPRIAVTAWEKLGSVDRGVLAPLQYTVPAAPSTPNRVLSDAASFMVRSILVDNPRPDGLANTRPQVASKTGTSWGFRDAWSVGIVGPYVLAVWAGNFDGSSNPALVGIQTAAPLFDSMHLRACRAVRFRPIPATPMQCRRDR